MQTNSIYFTEPKQPVLKNLIQSISDLNNISLRHLQQRKRQTNQDIKWHTSHESSFIRESMRERRQSVLQSIRREYQETKLFNLNTKKKQQQQRIRIQKQNFSQKIKSNAFRVFAAQMEKKHKIKNAAQAHNQIKQQQAHCQMSRDTQLGASRCFNQKLKKDLLNKTSIKQNTDLIKKQQLLRSRKYSQLKTQQQLRMKYEIEFKNLLQKEAIALRRAQNCIKFKQEGNPLPIRFSRHSKSLSHSKQLSNRLSKIQQQNIRSNLSQQKSNVNQFQQQIIISQHQSIKQQSESIKNDSDQKAIIFIS